MLIFGMFILNVYFKTQVFKIIADYLVIFLFISHWCRVSVNGVIKHAVHHCFFVGITCIVSYIHILTGVGNLFT